MTKSGTLKQRRVTQICALETVTHNTYVRFLQQLLDVFCLKLFASGLPCTGDTGRNNRHQSPGCQKGRHSSLALRSLSCSPCSCSVTFRVSKSQG